MNNCTKPNCDCIEKAEEKAGGPIKSYPCLAPEEPAAIKSQLKPSAPETGDHKNVIEKLMSNQKDIDPEISKAVQDGFWDMLNAAAEVEKPDFETETAVRNEIINSYKQQIVNLVDERERLTVENGAHKIYLNKLESDKLDLHSLLKSKEEDNAKFRIALDKINAIRNSIIGMQGFNFSEHAYPLVAALNEAGIKGAEYPEARENFGTMLQRALKAEIRIKELEEALRLNDAWPLTDVLQKLIEGTDILLHQKDYDALGWENFEHAFKCGKDILSQLKKLTPRAHEYY